ncbi:MAG: YfbK domain-containing protein [Bacteroidota bacterium]
MKKLSILFFITILMVGFTSMLNATHKVTGKVMDENKQALPGVNVIEKNTTNGTITDLNGEFTIVTNSPDATLVFSYVGFVQQEIKIEGKTTLMVTLVPDNVNLEEVVVVNSGIKIRGLASSAANIFTKKESNQAFMVADYESQRHTNFNTEGYSTIHENGFRDVSLNPLSTFSIDVDAASYSNVRRFLNQGSLPPKDAVRIEEMINYFTYEYAEPTGEEPFAVHTELTECPWNNDNQLVMIGLQGKRIPAEEIPPSNIVFLIDVSGSMHAYNKLPLLKSSLKLLVNQLRPEDKVAMVVYAGSSGIVLPSTPGDHKTTIIDALDQLQAGGSTAGGAGLKLAYKVASENFIDGGNNRIILASDGDFNVGSSSNAEMERLIEKEREKGIFISVLGYGMGNYKDDKMEIIANKGNGNYAYIDNIQEAQKVLVSEFGGTLFTIARDVKLQVEFNPEHVKAYRLIGYENRLLNEEDFDDDKKDAGELGAGHSVTALYEIELQGSGNSGGRTLRYQQQPEVKEKPGLSAELLTINLRYKEPDGHKSKLISHPVLNESIPFNQTSDNLRFAASVAQFGMLLRESDFIGEVNYDDVVSMARDARGEDEEGYRSEFIRLVNLAGNYTEGLSKR